MDIIRIFVGDRLAFEGHQVRDIGYPTAEDPYWTIHLVDGRTVDTTERITIVRGAQTNTKPTVVAYHQCEIQYTQGLPPVREPLHCSVLQG